MRVAGSFENKIKPTEKKWPLFFSRLPLHRQMTSSLSECAGFQFVKWPLRRVYTRQWKLVHRPCSVTGFFFQQKGNIRRFPSPKRGQRELRYWKTTNRMMAASWQETWWTFPFGLTRQSDETSIRLQNWPMMAIEGKSKDKDIWISAPGIRYCMLTASSFSRSRRRQMAAQENRIEEMRANPTPIQAIMYDQS